MLYLSAATQDGGFALSTLRGWMAAINRVHLEAGLPPPGQHPAMGMFLRGLSRQLPHRAAAPQMSALRIDGVRAICKALEVETTDFRTLRDRALLCLHALGLGDGEISRLSWDDIHLSRHALRIHVRSPRPGRPSHHVEVRAGHSLGDVSIAALRALEAHTRGPAHDGTWPVFTPAPTTARSGCDALSPKGVFQVRKSRLTSLGAGGERASTEAAILLLDGSPSMVLRDTALILVGFAGAFRRNELTGLVWDDVAVSSEGLVVTLRRSKTDLAGRGCEVGIPRGRSELTCPVTAMQRWRDRCLLQLNAGRTDPSSTGDARNPSGNSEAGDPAGVLREQPVFCTVGRAGRLGTRPLTAEALTRVVRLRASQAGIEGHWGGRSLRAGFISTAADLEIPLEAIARQSRHATLDTLAMYIRHDDPFRRNPAARVGL
ncbi:hypothetical protein GCM10027601_10950 [Nocardioides ungokensis]